MAPIPLETATVEDLKNGLTNVGETRAWSLIALRLATDRLTFAMIEALLGEAVPDSEKARFVEWLGPESLQAGPSGAASLRGHPKERPKDCSFDGKSSWVGFRRKFNSYKDILGWSEDRAKDFLEWSMTGAAQDFFVMKLGNGGRSLKEMMGVLEQRYGVNELEDSARARLETSYQREEEPLEEWADRVQTLTVAAYRNCPEDFATKEAIMRFCQGVQDIEAGKFVQKSNPKSVEEAVNGVRKYQHVERVARDSRQSREVVAVKEVREESQVLSKLLEVVNDMKKSLDDRDRGYRGGWRGRGRGRGGFSRSNPNIMCYACDKMGHMARECPLKAQWLGSENGTRALNWMGQGDDDQPSSPSQ